MKAYFLSDNLDTFIGLKIAGINGNIVQTPEAIMQVLEIIKNDSEIGILVFTEKAAMLIPDKIEEMKMSKQGPLIVEIPDRHGSIKGKDSILRYVKEAIGLKI